MKCCNCKYYKEWHGCSESGNECELFRIYYFLTFYNDECFYINDDYELTEIGIETLKMI